MANIKEKLYNEIVEKIKNQAKKESDTAPVSLKEVKNVKNLFKINQNILWKYLQKKESF
jgi:hypothetical protein